MAALTLVEVSSAWEQQIQDYRRAFPKDRERVTPEPDRIPGLDGLEAFSSVREWVAYCASMRGKITWYLAVRESDGQAVGALVLRHLLAYDDDDPEFCSHIGYSIRPDERRKGYAKEQLRLGLKKAKALGLASVRLICRDTNIGSDKTIRACGGVYVDTLHGEESGMNVNRYDIFLS